jgi:hypothetical protein
MQYPQEFGVEKIAITVEATEMNVEPPYFFTGFTLTSTDLVNAYASDADREEILNAVLDGFKVIAQKLAMITNAPQAFLREDAIRIAFTGVANSTQLLDTSEEV